MVSPYAALRSFGASAATAFMEQATVAIAVLAIVCLVAYRGVPARQSLGITAIASLLFSPYAYDYDLPILGVGLALLLPDILRGSRREPAAIFALSFMTCAIGLVQTFLRPKAPVDSIAMAGDNLALSVVELTLLIIS